MQEGWGLGAPVLPPCVFALALCRSHLSRNRPVNHPKTHCWMLWLWTMFNHFSPFSWQRLHAIWGLFPSNVIIMYTHNNDHYNNNFGVLSPEQIIQNHIHDSRSLLTSDLSLLQHVTLAWLPILFGSMYQVNHLISPVRKAAALGFLFQLTFPTLFLWANGSLSCSQQLDSNEQITQLTQQWAELVIYTYGFLHCGWLSWWIEELQNQILFGEWQKLNLHDGHKAILVKL